jgi:ATP-dependent RNA helicase RhlE
LSFTQFKLDARLLTNVERAGYEHPTPIQTAAIPAVLAGADLIGTAQTGTGKTAAFVLPMLNRLMAGPRGCARALIVTPTRELAEQINESIRMLGAGTRIRSATVYGGVSEVPQLKAFKDGVEILVACPGRLLDHISQRNTDLKSIEMLVLDEADRMLDMGFLPDVRRILSCLPARRQTMLFSATFPEEIEQLAARALIHPRRFALSLRKPVHTVEHALYPVAQHLKTPLLLALLKKTDTDSVLIFTRTRHRATSLAKRIAGDGHKVASLHSDRTQGQRQAALNGFRSGAFRILVATDIAARGIDVDSISHVINFDMPDTADAYIHRIGRTGRANRSGDAFTLVTSEDESMIRSLEKIMEKRLPRETVEGFDYKAPKPAHVSTTGASNVPVSRGRNNGNTSTSERTVNSGRFSTLGRTANSGRPANSGHHADSGRPVKSGYPADSGRASKPREWRPDNKQRRPR